MRKIRFKPFYNGPQRNGWCVLYYIYTHAMKRAAAANQVFESTQKGDVWCVPLRAFFLFIPFHSYEDSQHSHTRSATITMQSLIAYIFIIIMIVRKGDCYESIVAYEQEHVSGWWLTASVNRMAMDMTDFMLQHDSHRCCFHVMWFSSLSGGRLFDHDRLIYGHCLQLVAMDLIYGLQIFGRLSTHMAFCIFFRSLQMVSAENMQYFYNEMKCQSRWYWDKADEPCFIVRGALCVVRGVREWQVCEFSYRRILDGIKQSSGIVAKHGRMNNMRAPPYEPVSEGRWNIPFSPRLQITNLRSDFLYPFSPGR